MFGHVKTEGTLSKHCVEAVFHQNEPSNLYCLNALYMKHKRWTMFRVFIYNISCTSSIVYQYLTETFNIAWYI